jgi:DNA-binding transcriptional LysR family regulator
MTRRHDDPVVQERLHALLDAVVSRHGGKQNPAAKELGVKQPAVSLALGGGSVPATWAPALCAATGSSLDAIYENTPRPAAPAAPATPERPRYADLPDWPLILERAQKLALKLEPGVEQWVWDFIARQRPTLRSEPTPSSVAELAAWIFRHELATFRPRDGEHDADPHAAKAAS